MMEEGLTREEAVRRIWTVDTMGLVIKDRPGLEDFKAAYARDVEEVACYECDDRERITLAEAIAKRIADSNTNKQFTDIDG